MTSLSKIGFMVIGALVVAIGFGRFLTQQNNHAQPHGIETPRASSKPQPAVSVTQAPSVSGGIVSQMRWPLEEANWDIGLPVEALLTADIGNLEALLAREKRSGPGRNLHRTIEALFLKGDPASVQKATAIAEALVRTHDTEDLAKTVSPHGIEYLGITQRQESGGRVMEAEPPNPQRPKVLNFNQLAYEYAALYLLTGDRQAAGRARDILLRFAEVAPQWPLYDRKNRPHPQSDTRYLATGTANGLWSVWYPLDLSLSLPMLRAYDILRPTLTPREDAAIRGFFTHQKELNDRFESRKNYHNLEGYRIAPQIVFGKVLERPDYVHEAVAFWKNYIAFSYAADGLWKELTPSYHQQVTSRTLGMVPPLVRTYHDPSGYVYPVDGTRLDALDLEKAEAPILTQIRRGLNVLAMPNGLYLGINDSWPGRDKVVQDAAPATFDAPGLLGVSGVAKLGAEGMVAFLSFDGLRGHDHADALNLTWFAGGREVFSETGYQALPGSGSSRWWHSDAASHCTVMVDERPHFEGREEQAVPPVQEGEAVPPGQLRQRLPGGARYANQGRLILWHAETRLAQAMEAEQTSAYPGVTGLFRRTVVLLPEGNGDGCLVEIFRIRGGRMHDFFLRGGLDEAYTLAFEADLKPAQGTLYKYIELRQTAEIRPPLRATTRYRDGYEVRSILGETLGSDKARLQLLVGEAPAIRRMGTAPFSLVRHQLTDDGRNLETCYVWVHEAGRAPKVRSVKTEADGTNLAITIERDGRVDRVFSSEDEQGHFTTGGWAFAGRLAFASEKPGAAPAGIVFHGGELTRSGATVAPASRSVEGVILATGRREAGASEDFILIRLAEGASLEGMEPRLAHIDFGIHYRFSIPVRKVEREEGGIRILLAHSPGFDLRDGEAVLARAPGFAYAGSASVTLDCRTRPPANP